jgi:hypothetical protein
VNSIETDCVSNINEYSILKEVAFENYITDLDGVINNRINLCKFRCGNHWLPISYLI